jgi:serine/threonine protein kinase
MISRKTTLSKKYTDVERLVCHSKTSLMMGVKDPKTGRSLVAKCILLLPENTHGEKGRQMALRTAAHMDPHWQEVTPRTVQEVMEEALAMYTLRKCSGAVDLVEVLLEPGNTRVVLVMELLEGGLLSDFMLDHTSGMKEPDVQAAASRLLEVLREAHKAGIAHHDLRPAHVMLTLEGRLDSVKLVDFSKGPGGGVAARPKFDHDVAIATSSQRWYQPPEVAVQESCETSVYAGNMWSFGWMLLAMLTGTEEVFEDPHPPWLVAEPRKLPSGHVQDAWFKMAQRWIDKELKTVLTKLRVHGARKESTDIIQKLLTVDPRERLTAEGALRHPWFQCTYM